ncbi:TPA: hypothetical protein DCX15_02755 [bacterium]|nr:hypothetical protein [bacterium]
MKQILGILLLVLIFLPPVEAKNEKSIEIQADHAVWDRKNNLTILSGNVVIIRKEVKLEASVVKALGELDNIEKMIGEGRVRIVDSLTKSVITGGYIEYDCLRQCGFVTLDPVCQQEEDNLRIASPKIEYFSKEKKSVATGGVEIHYKDLIARSEEAVYYTEEGRLILTGNPQVVRSESRLNGEGITVYTKEDRFQIMGGVRGTILTQSPP